MASSWLTSWLSSWGSSWGAVGGGGPAPEGTPVANTVAPVVSGDLTRGSILSCTTGTWTGTEPISYAYQWRRDGENLFGSNESSYTVVYGDINRDIDCLVTAMNSVNVATAASNSVTILGRRFSTRPFANHRRVYGI